jgi:hypothetical protein
MVLSKVFNQPVKIKDNDVYDINDKIIYYENSDGDWFKKEYDTNGNEIYYEDSDGNEIYYENSTGTIIEDNRYE